MNPEQYRRAKEIFWQAQDQAPDQLETFLETACAGDLDLVAEVRRLLGAAEETPESFLEPGTGPELRPVLDSGRVLDHYRVLGQIGRGGMGEVYRAEDLSLKREVALKVLPADLAGDSSRLERFQREAESIAALNHPNIVTIYSIEQADDLRFLTMELVQGESLDQVMPEGGMPLPQVVDLGIALARALTAAHEKGIVHRDLKPSNVMLTDSGVIKVLDFGLAKVARTMVPDDTEAATRMATLTREGVVVGTAAYMSPEQAKGTAVDTRSDIFSLGCLLYEAATGQRPFAGSSSIDILHNILHQEPTPLSERSPEAPPQLSWVLGKCLAKDPDDRYQTAADLTIDLKGVQRELDSATRVSGTPPIPAAAPSDTPAKRSLAGGVVAGVIAVSVLAVGATIWTSVRSGSPERQIPAASEPISIERLTTSGKVTGAAISPDGNYFAYSVTEEAQGQSLRIQQIARGQSLELVPTREVGYWSIGFTPDGSEVLFGQKSRAQELEGIFRISTLGGKWQTVAAVGLDSLIDVSPDGARMAWFRAQYPESGQSSLVVATADGADVRPLVTLASPDFFVPIFYSGPSWSPDGRYLAGAVNTSALGALPRIEVYEAEGGEVEWSRQLEFAVVSHVRWLRDGSGILFVANRLYREDSQIWLLPYPEGPPTRITNDLLLYRMLTLTTDGEALLTVGADPTAKLWSMASDGSSRPRQIPAGRLDGYFGFSILADGRLAYPVEKAGTFQLALADLDGSNQVTLTSGTDYVMWPRATPDGDIVYVAVSSSRAELRRIGVDGANPVTLVISKAEMQPDVSSDGRWVVYQDPTATGFSTLWRVPATGGTPEQLTTYEAERVAISPDSTRIAFYYRESVADRWKIGIAPITGGAPSRSFDGIEGFASSFVRWSDDARSLLFNSVPGDRANLYRLPLEGGEAVKMTDFSEPRLSWVDFSPDGKTMVFARVRWERDAILIRNFN